MRPVSINMQSPMRAGGLAFRAGAQAQPSVIRDAPHSDGYSIQRPVKPLSPAQVSTWMRFLCWLGGTHQSLQLGAGAVIYGFVKLAGFPRKLKEAFLRLSSLQRLQLRSCPDCPVIREGPQGPKTL